MKQVFNSPWNTFSHKQSFMLGYNKNLKQLGMRDVTEIVDILKCHSIKMAIPEINQFSEGLETLGILSYIKKYPDVMMDVFVDNGQRLTCGKCKIL